MWIWCSDYCFTVFHCPLFTVHCKMVLYYHVFVFGSFGYMTVALSIYCMYVFSKKIVSSTLCGAAGMIVMIHGSERANTDIGYDRTYNHFQMWEQVAEQRHMCMASVSCTWCNITIILKHSHNPKFYSMYGCRGNELGLNSLFLVD